MRRTKKKKKQNYIEARGLLFITLGVLFLISLISFSNKDPSKNFLGIVGYWTSWISTATFGLGSYLIGFHLIYRGIHFILLKKIENINFKNLSFFLFLSCSCILINVLAETSFDNLSFFNKKVIQETTYSTFPYPKETTRYNLGGIPFYYLYTDIPYINFQNLLSNIGTFLIFFLGGIAFFFLTYNIKIIPSLKYLFFTTFKLFKTLINGFTQTAIFLKNLKSAKISKPKTPYQYNEDFIKIKEQKKFSFLTQKKEENFQKRDLYPKKYKENISISKTLPLKERSSFYFSKNISYRIPPLSLLSNPVKIDTPTLKKELRRQAEILEETLKSFGIKAKVGEINCGPTITSFEVHPAVGVKVQKIKTLENDIALNMQAKSMRIVAPIPGKAAVGVEIPSIHPQKVTLKEMLIYYNQVRRKHSIPILLGKTVSGDHVITDLAKMPHLLIAGATGSGKSVCINTIVMSILMNLHPDDVKLIMIDPKKVELTQYSKLPHMIAPVITEANGAYSALQWLVQEMKKRYETLKQLALRNITSFNTRRIRKDFEESLSIEIPKKFPLIVAIIDEFADLMMVSSSDLETPIARIAQMARAVGIHLILATQRPSREVITGIIKANFPSRIAFKVSNRINSQIILDENGSESLLGNGDLLFLPPGSSKLIRAQGAYISDEDINKCIDFISKQKTVSYLIDSFDSQSLDPLKDLDSPKDKLYDKALSIVVQSRNASTTFLQRKLKIGYARAASLMDELENQKIIGPQEKSRPRKVLKTIEYLEK